MGESGEKETGEELTPARLARDAVEAFIRDRQMISPPEPLPELLRRRAGAFVCLKREGQLRGCIGTMLPTTENLASEIIRNAVQAAISDPRFMPLSESELDELDYTVDILSEPEPVRGPEELNPKVYGCIVRGPGGRLGLLLPDLEGVETVEQQVRICRQKGGISAGEPVELERFTVTRYGED